MKKVILAIIAIFVLTSSFCFAASKFYDVNGTKYESAVTALNNLGIVDGFTDGSFKPQGEVTRAQLCKMLVTSLKLQQKNNVALTQFSDVNQTMWSYSYIKIAVDNGVIKGYTDGTFRPDSNVKFSELYTMIIRAMGSESSVINPSNWPNSYMEYAQGQGLIANVVYSNVTDAANRGEVAIAIYNMVNKLNTNGKLDEVKTGWVESVSGGYVTIDGTRYSIATNTDAFEEDTVAVFKKNGVAGNVTLINSYGVSYLDGKANIIDAVSGSRAGDQEVRYVGSSKYVDYFTSSNKNKYKDYTIALITIRANAKDALVVSKHSFYSSLSEIKFAVGDRIVADADNEVFLVFRGLSVDDVAKKGKLVETTTYYTISYEWNYGEKPAGISLPKDDVVEAGTTYHIKYPNNKGLDLEFYCTNVSTESFVVKKDVTLYISTVDFRPDYATISYEWDGEYPAKAKLPSDDEVEIGSKYTIKLPTLKGYEFSYTNNLTKTFTVNNDVTIYIYCANYEEEQGGHAGSNMPLIDKVSEKELKQALESALADNFGAVQCDVKKVKFTARDTDSVNFSATYNLIFDPVDVRDLRPYTAGSGVEDYDSWSVNNKSNIGVLELNSIGGYYYVYDLNTGN